jgi:mannosyltransferase
MRHRGGWCPSWKEQQRRQQRRWSSGDERRHVSIEMEAEKVPLRPTGGRGRLAALGFALPGAIAFALGSIQLGSRSIWIDESASISIASQHGGALGSAIARDGGNMAGYYALLHVVVTLFGDGLIAVRMPSVIASAMTATLVTALGLRLFGYRASLAAGLLAAISLPSVFWAQDARSYAMLAMFVTASYLALVVLLDAPSRALSARVAGAAYVITIVAALYMSLVAAFILIAQVIFVVATRRRRLRGLIVAAACVALLSIPLVAIAIHRGSGQLFWIPRPSWTTIQQVAVALTSAGFQPDFSTTASGLVLVYGSLALLAVGLFAWLNQGKQKLPQVIEKTGRELGPELMLSWLLVPLVVTFVESFVTAPSFTDRDMLIVLPAVALALGAILACKKVPLLFGCAAMAALIALRLVVLVPTYGKSSENWSRATDALVAASTPGTCIAFYPSDGRMAVAYYLETQHHAEENWFRPVLPTAPLTQMAAYLEIYRSLDASQVHHVEKSCASLWLVSSHEGSPSGTAISQANYRRFVGLRRELSTAYPHERTESFGWAAPVTLEFFTR